MLHVIDTSNTREESKEQPRDTVGFMEDARARLIEEATSPDLVPSTEASTAAALVHTASMLRMLYLRPDGAQ
ncbi:hypothetical protein LXT21_43005 [Myxococcus sp. K38C18041901]|uniref:hypothetical protein n=1 Tax=Myxococcus guangdongensis TaxID=2906760 RepID=UPI0020A7988B|nr:hypothetical protein [Myxococcus guangdongensis]MCP3065556.1 hypothetical protein [Myxococcus guangdongensis]